ncbi:hypothetical protein HU200_038610 [Digitaria exilis]|uniref:HIRAN domain-containing protein n=1 Tax=Digitaria exilis TaxID=1010633 RepID=A0A835EJU2_9POAL|nr:hypothetical protein HU200_038610 [Digitaria exilis]CAB3449860.1 unnamed protein product [Digitaria exilis]
MSCDSAERRDPPELSSGQPAVSDDDMAAFRAVLGADLPVSAAVDALTRCGGDTERAIKWLLDNASADSDGGDVESGNGPTGDAAPVSAPRSVKAEPGIGGGAAHPQSSPPPVKVEAAREVKVEVKTEPIDVHPDEVKVKVETSGEEEVKVKVEAPGEAEIKAKTEPIEAGGAAVRRVKEEEEADEVDVKEDEEEPPLDSPIKGEVLSPRRVKEDESDCSEGEVEMMDPAPRSKKRPYEEDGVVFIDLTTSHPAPYLNPKPIRAMPPRGAIPTNEWRMVVAPPPAELDECPPDRCEWCFFKKSYATGLSTCRGRKLLDGGEVVHFAFPSYDRIHGGLRVSYRQAAALAEIVRFSTNRSGELGKLSPVWAKCLAPLVNSFTIMVQGKIVFPMMELRLMQEVLLYVSFYVHRSSMCLIAPEYANHPDNPLRGLFKLLRRFGVPDV